MKKSVKKQEAYTFSFTLTKEEEKQIKKFTDGKGAKGIHWNGTDTYLKRAICDKNTEMALLLIKAGADINALDKDGYTPLYWAGVYDNREVALQLIKKGADVNARGKYADPPLTRWTKDATVFAAMVNAGADINAVGKSGITPFLFACEHMDIKFVISLLPQVKDINRSSSWFDDYSTYLDIACGVRKDEALIKALIQYGADPKKLKAKVRENLDKNLEKLLLPVVDESVLIDVATQIAGRFLRNLTANMTNSETFKKTVINTLASSKLVGDLLDDDDAEVIQARHSLADYLKVELHDFATDNNFDTEQIKTAVRDAVVLWQNERKKAAKAETLIREEKTRSKEEKPQSYFIAENRSTQTSVNPYSHFSPKKNSSNQVDNFVQGMNTTANVLNAVANAEQSFTNMETATNQLIKSFNNMNNNM